MRLPSFEQWFSILKEKVFVNLEEEDEKYFCVATRMD
jgi:hypothetical protein